MMLKSIFILLLISCVFCVTPKRLIEFSNGTRTWMTNEEIEALASRPGIKTNFIDITDYPYAVETVITAKYPSKPTQQALVKPFLEKIERESPSRLNATIHYLSTHFTTRHCKSQEGVEASKWLAKQYQEIIDNLPPERKKLFEVTIFNHTGFPQQSIIVKMKTPPSKTKQYYLIAGAHMDSISKEGPAPGADDNASGSAGILEIFRLIAQSDFVPLRPVEFHAYACEELGLLGSRPIANAHRNKKEGVYAMLNLDMIGYPKIPKIGFALGHTHKDLNSFMLKLAAEYLNVKAVEMTAYGYTSDSGAWALEGYPSTWPWENWINGYMHTPKDTLDKLDMKFASEYVKLGVAFFIELGLSPY